MKRYIARVMISGDEPGDEHGLESTPQGSKAEAVCNLLAGLGKFSRPEHRHIELLANGAPIQVAVREEDA